jgi:UDP-GlcNAc:undecaprenyl-phosphate GlcNAc-1-phosphate transferase
VVRAYAVAFLGGLLLAVVLTRFVRDFSVARRWVVPPKSNRHVHAFPVPRLGGVAIFMSFLAVIGVAVSQPKMLNLPGPFAARIVLAILGPAMIVFLMGLYDDFHSLRPYWKFGIQTAAAICLYLGGIRIHQFDLFGVGRLLQTAIALPLTIFWVLLITNAFNLIDGLDGLAGGSALFSTIVVFLMSLLMGNQLVAFLSIALGGTIAGFLHYNFYPATIFLGDSVSLFTGFVLSALALAGSQKSTTIVAVAIPMVAFGLPILDVCLAVTRRFLSRKPLFEADDDHIHHKLLNRGLSQREAVLLLYLVTAGFAVLSLVLLHNAGLIALVLGVIGIGVWFGVKHLRYSEFSELQALVQRAKRRKESTANNIRIRRAAEALNSCADFQAIHSVLKDTLQPLGFDGFQLKIDLPDHHPESCLTLLPPNGDSSLQNYPGHPQTLDFAWELTLELIPAAGHTSGHFTLFRTSRGEPLLVDFDLLCSEFRIAVSNAVRQAMSRAEESGRVVAHEDPPLAAKAASTSSSD